MAKIKRHVYDVHSTELDILRGYLVAQEYHIAQKEGNGFEIWKGSIRAGFTGFMENDIDVVVTSQEGKELDLLMQTLDMEKLKETLREIKF